MAEHNELGRTGEYLAIRFLDKKGFTILERNFRYGHLELDIITQKDDLLVIVEVKTRQSEFMAGPEDTVSKKKQRAIIKATNHYIKENDLDIETRFDIISIIHNTRQTKVDHIEDAFYPSMTG